MSASPIVEVSAQLPLDSFSLDVDLTLFEPITAVLGPSGSGKTSFLELLAGLRKPSRAHVIVRGRVLENSSKGNRVSPEKRKVGYLPQEVLLFPHHSVRENILYGAFRNGSIGGPAFEAVVEALEIRNLLDSSPQAISGGEKQRVGLARALMSGPNLLLLDEPFSSLDRGLKTRILPYLNRIRDQFHVPMLYVTHDASDILALGDEVIVLDRGKVVAQGEPERTLEQTHVLPQWVPRPMENLLQGEVESHFPEKGMTRIKVGETFLWAPLLDMSPGTRIQVDIPSEDILVALTPPANISARNILEGRIETGESSRGTFLLKVWAGFFLRARLTPDAVDDLGLTPGKRVYLVLKSSSIRCF